jgi:hypothetical protein
MSPRKALNLLYHLSRKALNLLFLTLKNAPNLPILTTKNTPNLLCTTPKIKLFLRDRQRLNHIPITRPGAQGGETTGLNGISAVGAKALSKIHNHFRTNPYPHRKVLDLLHAKDLKLNPDHRHNVELSPTLRQHFNTSDSDRLSRKNSQRGCQT